MNTRRVPFQFSTTDPLARQRELEKRFGLQPTCPKMYVDVNNPLSMDTTPKEISSPRLQHRVPIFVEGYDHPIHSSSVDSMASVPENKKQNVRFIPIEIEGADKSPRHRTYSGPAGRAKDHCDYDSLPSERNGAFKRFNFEDMSKSSKPKTNAGPKVFNIPIQVEGANNVSKSPKSTVNKVDLTQKPKSTVSTSTGCFQSNTASQVGSSDKSEVPSSGPSEKQIHQPKNTVEILLKKIEDVLNEFKAYETGVIEFTGTSKDKQYRYLDEMLTRCMLRLDDIDTMGNEEIRLARKSAVKKIQASIDLLERKANVEPVTSNEISEMELIPDEKNVDNEVGMQQDIPDNTVTTENAESSEMKLIGCDNKDQSKIYDSNLNEDKTSSKMESMKSEEKSNIVTDVEMHEMPQDKASTENTSLCETTNTVGSFGSKASDLSEVSSKAGDMHVKENSTSSLQQQNHIPEIEMSEEISLDNISSKTDAHSSELLGSANKCVEQNSVSNETVTNDVEMLDDSDLMSHLVEGKESLNEFPKNESHLLRSSDISEVEMDEIGDISSKESCEKNENDSQTVDLTGNVNVQVTSNVHSEDTEINGVHQTINDCLTDLSEQSSASETSPSEKDKTLKD